MFSTGQSNSGVLIQRLDHKSEIRESSFQLHQSSFPQCQSTWKETSKSLPCRNFGQTPTVISPRSGVPELSRSVDFKLGDQIWLREAWGHADCQFGSGWRSLIPDISEAMSGTCITNFTTMITKEKKSSMTDPEVWAMLK